MPDPIITNVDTGNVIYNSDYETRPDTFTAAGAATFKAGTILARDSVSEKLVVYEKGGSTNENGIPKRVLTYEVVSAGAGDIAIDALLTGKVRLERLVIDADGDASNVDAVVIDLLQDYNITALNVDELNQLDNPNNP